MSNFAWSWTGPNLGGVALTPMKVFPGETLNCAVVAADRICTKPGMLPTTMVWVL